MHPSCATWLTLACPSVEFFQPMIRYNVVEGDSVDVLDIYGRSAIDLGDGGYIRRYSTNPTQDANIDLADTIAAGTSCSRK